MPPGPAAAMLASATRSVFGSTVVAIVERPDRGFVPRSIRRGGSG